MMINVLEYLEATYLRSPDKLAIVDGTGSYAFDELRQRARELAGIISSMTSGRNLPIGVYLPKSKDCVVAFAAVLYSGNCYSPLDPKSPIQRIATTLSTLCPLLVITDAKNSEALASTGFASERTVLIDSVTSHPDRALPLPDTISTDPAYIIHTSGSTGVPKGVAISHASIIDYIDWAQQCYGIEDRDKIGNQAPFYFDNSVLDIYLCLATGATLVIIPEEHFAFPLKLMEYLQQKGITFIFWVPSVLSSIANLDILAHINRPPLRRILFAGEVMHNKHLNYWRRFFPGALFSNLYGPTEITVDCTYYIVDREFEDDEPLPIGFPCRNTDILILNDRNEPCQTGELGELCVRGTSLAMGYWNAPDKTAKAFVQNPLNPHYPEVIYRTGDLVFRNQRGEITFSGRKDFQIKHLGYRIELAEIEHHILAIDGISYACVLYNEAQKEITTFYVKNDHTGITPALIRKTLSAILPKYMLPTVFHELPELPRNPNGKIDRHGLKTRLSEKEAVES